MMMSYPFSQSQGAGAVLVQAQPPLNEKPSQHEWRGSER